MTVAVCAVDSVAGSATGTGCDVSTTDSLTQTDCSTGLSDDSGLIADAVAATAVATAEAC